MSALHHRLLNGWPLFFSIAVLMLIGIIAGLLFVGISTPESTVSMIRLSVRLAAPWIYIAFVTSALVQLFPGNVSNWLSRNRRYIGLSFAAGFTWQAVFIAVLLVLFPAHYWEQLHNDTDLFLRMLSYLFLLALTVSSFFPIRRKMRSEHWRWLHWAGIWYFWAAIWVSYAGQALSPEVRAIDLVYTALGLLVLRIRITAYQKARVGKSNRKKPTATKVVTL